jgi:hypothetical protein
MKLGFATFRTSPRYMVLRRGVLCAAALWALSGCASTGSSTQGQDASGSVSDQMQDAAGDAARQPLRDIGLMKRKIPYALSRIADPYADPSGPGCVWITYELTQLSAALGSDVAVMPGADNSSTRERGSNMVLDAARDFIRNSGAAIIPGRSLVRRFSGATSSEELYKAAERRGQVRRGYLKGLSEAKNCS